MRTQIPFPKSRTSRVVAEAILAAAIFVVLILAVGPVLFPG